MNRALSDIIGTDQYYTQVATTNLKIKSQDGAEDVGGQAYVYKITKAADPTQVGKYGLTTTYEKDGKSNTDTYIGTQGEVLVLLRNLKDQSNTTNAATPATVKTKSYSDATPLTKQGNKPVDVTAADKEWKAAGGNTVTRGTTSINQWDVLGEETNQNANPELSASNLAESSDKNKVLGNVNDNIELTFNETVANPNGIELWDADANAKVAATVSLGNDSQTPTVENNKVIIDPNSALRAGGKYEVRNSGVTKLADLAVRPNAVSDPVVNFSVGGTPGATGSAPAASSTDLGTVNADDASAKVDITFDKDIAAANTDGSISIKVNGTDQTLSSDGYTITGKTLSINKGGIDALGITNNTPANKLIVNADQIADKADPTKKNVATDELPLKTEAPAAADSNPNPNITTAADQEFSKAGPIELTFENSLQLVPGKTLDGSNIVIQEVDDAGNAVPGGGVIPSDLVYATNGNKLIITTATGFIPQKRYQIVIQPDVFLKDDGATPYSAQLGLYFKAVTPTL